MPSVLLVSNDPPVQQITTQALTREGLEVVAAEGAEAAVHTTYRIKFDILVLDDDALEPWEADGLVEWVRSRNGGVGIVYLSTQGREQRSAALMTRDRVVSKPFTSQEIRRAVSEALATPGHPHAAVPLKDGLELDLSSRQVRGPRGAITLSPTEFRLVECLLQRRGSIIPVRELLEEVWGLESQEASPSLVRSHMRNLRAKLRGLASRELIQTLPRHGYRMAL